MRFRLSKESPIPSIHRFLRSGFWSGAERVVTWLRTSKVSSIPSILYGCTGTRKLGQPEWKRHQAPPKKNSTCAVVYTPRQVFLLKLSNFCLHHSTHLLMFPPFCRKPAASQAISCNALEASKLWCSRRRQFLGCQVEFGPEPNQNLNFEVRA